MWLPSCTAQKWPILSCPAQTWAVTAIHAASMCSQHGCMLQAEAKAWRGEVETVTRCGHLAGAPPAPQQCVKMPAESCA